MALFEFSQASLIEIPSTTYAALRLREREDVQPAIREHIEIVSPRTMVLAEEFGNWEDSKRRIDLLGLDSDGCLVVVELKRTEDGGHMELQALRYAAMVSAMKFEQAVDAHRKYLASRNLPPDTAEAKIREFLGIADGPIAFSNRVRIVLASADFSKEVTSAVLWLNEQGLDITCFRIRPYSFGDRVLMDVQQVIPLPEAAEFQVAIREKTMELAAAERARVQDRDLTRYAVTVKEKTFSNLPKRRAIYQVIRHLCDAGVDPEEVRGTLSGYGNAILSVDEEVGAKEFEEILAAQLKAQGKKTDIDRYFRAEDELIRAGGRTYAVTKMWGTGTIEYINALLERFPGHEIILAECS